MKVDKVIIVDDEPIIRDGLRDWLSPEYETLCFDSSEAFLEAFDAFDFDDSQPTCMLLDFQMPGMNGVELQHTLKAMNLEFPIIFMSGNAMQADIIDAWHGGAVDFILKPFSATQISQALIAQFELLKQHVLSRAAVAKTEPIVDLPITKREAEVLLLLGKGHQQNEVASLLGISLRTVKMYRLFLKNKLNLNSLAELVRYYDQHHQSILKVAQGQN